jgi:uncharacterized iron-regulated membrane protein
MHRRVISPVAWGLLWFEIVIYLLKTAVIIIIIIIIIIIQERSPSEKFVVPQQVQKFPAFHATGRFVTVLTAACCLCISWAR